MPESLTEFFSSGYFMPHGHCYLWKPGLVWLQVLSNGLIGISYVAISSTLAFLVYRLRDEIPFKAMYLAFGAFVVLCGATHFFDIYVIWRPAYWLDGSVRALTAVVSAATALLLPPLIPHASALARGAKAARDRGIELQTAVKDLGTMYQRTKEIEQLKSQFFANVSHELRTPVALILGPVEKLLTSGNLTTEQYRDLDVVLRNARTLLKHVNDLLDAARLEAGKMTPEFAETDVAQLVRLTAANFDGLAAERGVGYVIEMPSSLHGQVDPDKLQRVVLNLLSNAFKFTPANGRIRCAVTEIDERSGQEAAARRYAVITVADSGPGIRPEHRSVIFERFRQLDGGSTRQVGGTGLGLAIAKDFVELHGGRISVGEAPEGGALFTVDLPLRAPAGANIRVAAAATGKEEAELARQALEELRSRVESLPSVQEKGRPLVLVVEDNPDMNRFICETLSIECRTESAIDGHGGLSTALALRPDLILTDIMMPGMSGDELVRAIRARPELRSVPIVLLTAKADDELRIKLLREGAQDYVIKPFAAEELRARVGNLVTLKRAQDVLREAKAAAEAANRELEAFSYSVSHDLRAPLRGLDGFSQALLEDHADRLDAQGKDYLQSIRAAAQRMSELIDDLLELSRVTRSELRPEEVNLSEIARAIVARLNDADVGRGVGILVIPEDLIAQGDPRLLHIVLENLLANAWKFTSKCSDGRIELGCTHDGNEPVYFVRDNGAGFDMAYADKLFAPFQRLHDEREFEGTGIGLATVQRIIHRHGGRVWAEGSVGHGATVYFTLSGS
jgi:signal transduction histidine kinase